MEGCGEMIGVVRLAVLCVCLLLVELGFSNVSGFMGGDGVAFVSRYLDSAFLPQNSLRMNAAVCDLGEN